MKATQYIYQPSANEAIVTTYHATPQTRGYVTHDKYIYIRSSRKTGPQKLIQIRLLLWAGGASLTSVLNPLLRSLNLITLPCDFTSTWLLWSDLFISFPFNFTCSGVVLTSSFKVT